MKKLSKFLIFLLSINSFNFILADDTIQNDLSKDQVLQKQDIVGNQSVDFSTGEILVKFKESKIDLKTDQGSDKLQNFEMSKNMEMYDVLEKQNIAVFSVETGEDIKSKINQLKSDPNVEIAQPNFLYKYTSYTPNDPYYSEQWGLNNSGNIINYTLGASGTDIKWAKTMEIFTGKNTGTGSIVAVIDDGVYYSHPDLINNMRDGSACKDYSGNAMGGCLHGYDTIYEDKDPTPDVGQSHGTHVAGIIGAQTNNNMGIAGVNPNVKIMAVKAGDASGLDTSSIIKAISFAKYNGAKIINASFGHEGIDGSALASNFDYLLYQSIKDFGDNGGLFVAAAGNNSNNHDNGLDSMYPADFIKTTDFGSGNVFSGLNNIISVAATDSSDNLSSFSDYGVNSVSLGAPGSSIFSTMPITKILNDNLSSVNVGSLPTYFTKDSGDWQVVLSGSTKYISPDIVNPYTSLINTSITSSAFDLSNHAGGYISFTSYCDTPYDSTNWRDYMSVLVSSGSNFVTGLMWDKYVLATNAGVGNLSGSIGGTIRINFGTGYSTNNFKIRFKWTTDNTDNAYQGCKITNLKIIGNNISGGGDYDFKDGTSMATPFVAGAASLLWTFRQDLGYQYIKNAIVNSGDSISALSGKTISGKRLNLYNSLLSLDDVAPSVPVLITFGYVSTGSISWAASIDTGVGLSGYNYLVSTGSSMIDILYSGSTSSTGVSLPLGYDTYYYQVRAQDKAGNLSAFSSTGSFVLEQYPGDISGSISLGSRYTSSTGISLNMVSSKPVNYIITGNLDTMYTGFLNLTGTVNIFLTGSDGTKNISVSFTDTGNRQLFLTGAIILDRVSPVMSISSHSSGYQTISNSIILSGNIADSFSITGFTISRVNNFCGSPSVQQTIFTGFGGEIGTGFAANLSNYNYTFSGQGSVFGTFGAGFGLTGGVNRFYFTGSDYAGNITGTSIDIIKLPVVTTFFVEPQSLDSYKMDFGADTYFNGYEIVYGTDPNNLTGTLTGGSVNQVLLNQSLIPNTRYYFKVRVKNICPDIYYSQWSTIKSIMTSQVIQASNLSGNQTFTGSVALTGSGVFGTGIKFNTGGNLIITGTDNNNRIMLPLTGLTIIATGGNWDGTIFAPYQIPSTGSVTLTGYTRLDTTFRIGNPNTEMIFSGGRAQVNLEVGTGYNNTTLKIYRSGDNGNSFDFLTSCVVTGGICSFETDRFSIFTMLVGNDTTPDVFSFDAQSNLGLGRQTTSNTITVGGISSAANISISNGEYQINSGSWLSAASLVNNGDQVRVRGFSPLNYNQTTSVILTIGGVSSTFVMNSQAVSSVGSSSSGGGGGGGGGMMDNNKKTSSKAIKTNILGQKIQTKEEFEKRLEKITYDKYSKIIGDYKLNFKIPQFNDPKLTKAVKLLTDKIVIQLNKSKINKTDLQIFISNYNKFILSIKILREDNDSSEKTFAQDYLREVLKILTKK